LFEVGAISEMQDYMIVHVEPEAVYNSDFFPCHAMMGPKGELICKINTYRGACQTFPQINVLLKEAVNCLSCAKVVQNHHISCLFTSSSVPNDAKTIIKKYHTCYVVIDRH